MKKFMAFFTVCLILFLPSCSMLEHIEVTGDSSKTPYSAPCKDTLYVANKSSRTYHLSSCHVALRIKEENKYETYDLDFLLSREFSPCKSCLSKEN